MNPFIVLCLVWLSVNIVVGGLILSLPRYIPFSLLLAPAAAFYVLYVMSELERR